MMKIYRSFLVVLIIVAIGFGVWYCVSSYQEQQTIKDGTLVFDGGEYAAGYCIY